METSHRRLSWSAPGRTDTVILSCFVALGAYLTARLAGVLMLLPQRVWPLWPGCALLAAVLLLVPRRIWPILMAAASAGFVFYDLQTRVPILSIAWLILADMVEVLTAALSLSYLFHGPPRLNSVRDLAKYSVFAVVVAPCTGALIGAIAGAGAYWAHWRIAFFSEALAFLTLTPAVLGWASKEPGWTRESPARQFEVVVLLAALFIIGYITLVVAGRNSPPALLYSLVPLLLWSALRFGSIGVSTSVIVVAFLSIWGAVHGRGPFSESELVGKVLSLQLFLLIAASPFMVLAALAEQHKHAEQALKNSEEKFSKAFRQSPTALTLSRAEDDRYIEINETLERVTGYSREEVVGRTPWELRLWADPPKAEEFRKLLLQESSLRNMEARFRAKDGKIRVALVSAELIDIGAEPCMLYMIEDTTERKASEQSLHELSGRLINAQEQERTRIARELHDDLSQRMALINVDIEEFERAMPNLPAASRERLYRIAQTAREISSDLHNLSYQLHPSKLEMLGLVKTVGSLCKELSNQHDLHIQFVHHDIPGQIPKDVTLCLFRIVQEALRNIVKHSAASQAVVELWGDRDGIALGISDSGVGFDAQSGKEGTGLGLISMRERLRLVGGSFSVDSKPSSGTRIHAAVPLPAESTRAASKPEGQSGRLAL